jgi:hypothetical protein
MDNRRVLSAFALSGLLLIGSIPAGLGASGTLLSGSQVAVTASGLAYSRINQTFHGTVTITNTGSTVIAGPLQIVLHSLTPGATLTNATGTYRKLPYVTVPGISSFAPGARVAVDVKFKSSGAPITFSPAIFAGSLN